MGFFQDAFGYGKHAGGARDAFSEYQRYLETITPYYQEGLAQYGKYTNPIAGKFSQMLDPLNAVEGDINAIPDMLRGSALAQGQGLASSAAIAARQAAGSRGGLAYSGGAANIAARAGAQASTGTNQALADAMLQGIQAKTQFAQMKSGAIGNVLSNEANLAESKFQGEQGFRQAYIGGLSNYASQTTQTGLAGNQKQSDRRMGFLGGILGNVLGY